VNIGRQVRDLTLGDMIGTFTAVSGPRSTAPEIACVKELQIATSAGVDAVP
jgi:hypothetical protein